jgi:hypothetical protein
LREVDFKKEEFCLSNIHMLAELQPPPTDAESQEKDTTNATANAPQFTMKSLNFAESTSSAFDEGVVNTANKPPPPIPRPPEADIRAAELKGVDPMTKHPHNPTWDSMLLYRIKPPRVLTQLTCNCLCQPFISFTRAQVVYGARLLRLILLVLFGRQWAMHVFDESYTAATFSLPTYHLAIDTHANATGLITVMHSNGAGVRVDILFLVCHLILIVFDAIFLALGPSDASVSWLWRQLDLCFYWFSGLEATAVMPLLTLYIASIVGIRVEWDLAAIFFLMFCVVALRVVHGMIRQPKRDAGRFYMQIWSNDILQSKEEMSFQDLVPGEIERRRMGAALYRQNFRHESIALWVGIAPFAFVWAWIINAFYALEYGARPVTSISDGDFSHLPNFLVVTILVAGIVSVLLTAVPIVYSRLRPMYNWSQDIVATHLLLVLLVVPGQLVFDAVDASPMKSLLSAMVSNSTSREGWTGSVY